MISALRQLLLLGLLLALIWAAGLLRTAGGAVDEGVPPGSVPMTLGFALVAAHLLGRLLARFELPAITGYLVAGVVLGPHLLGFVPLEFKESLALINRIALGMIALTAGGELALGEIRPRIRTIAWITGLHTLALLAGTTALVVLLGRLAPGRGWELGPIEGLTPSQVLAVGLVLGLVAVAKSPASTVAVIAETGSRGPLTTVALGVTVLKDVVVILLMSIVLGTAGSLIDPAVTFRPAELGAVAAEIVASLACGGLLGGALVAWLGRVRRETAFFLLGALFLTLEGSLVVEELAGIHIHFLVVCMTAGFAVENLSSRGPELIRGLERSSLPVYVLFFTLAGVGLDLGSLALLWPLALGFVAWRAGLLLLTTWWGARLGGESRTVARWAWTAFLTQAGVSLGLAELVAARWPQIGGPVRTLILAAIAVNQLLGPVLFKLALRRCGEAGRGLESPRVKAAVEKPGPVAADGVGP